MGIFVVLVTIIALYPISFVQANGGCDFAYGQVKFCDWTPWSDFSCDGCCTGTGTSASRTRGLCCGGTTGDCFFKCGIDTNNVTKSETSDCDKCTCPGQLVTPSGYICYKDDNDVEQCGGQCDAGNDWGQCVRDCSVHKTETLCTILETSLFFLGLAIGISFTALLACLLYRRKRRRWEKRVHSSTSQRTTMMTINNDPYNSYTGVYETKRGPPQGYFGGRMGRVHAIDHVSGSNGYNDGYYHGGGGHGLGNFGGRDGREVGGNNMRQTDLGVNHRMGPNSMGNQGLDSQNMIRPGFGPNNGQSGMLMTSGRPGNIPPTIGSGRGGGGNVNSWMHM